MPVVIRFSSSADCLVISGMVTTPPPRPSRCTLSTLMTVMARGYSGTAAGRPAQRAHLAFRDGATAAATMSVNVARDTDRQGPLMRLPALTELTPRQQEISDAIAAKRGATRGPFLIWLRSPELAEKVDALGAYCRF